MKKVYEFQVSEFIFLFFLFKLKKTKKNNLQKMVEKQFIVILVVSILALVAAIVAIVLGIKRKNGPQGPQGPDGSCDQACYGITGPQGPQGLQGFTGSAGRDGTNGTDGRDGTDGANGADGSTGPTGSIGPQGYQGFTGSIGPQGYQGFTGSPGQDGSCPADCLGPTGPAGPTGSAGIGTIGPQGPQGYTGSQGPQGYTGSQGSQGYTGSQGDQGLQGSQGFTGPQGPQGYQGFTGPQGPQGDQGFTGPQGPQGPTGPSVSGPVVQLMTNYLIVGYDASAMCSAGQTLFYNTADGSPNCNVPQGGVQSVLTSLSSMYLSSSICSDTDLTTLNNLNCVQHFGWYYNSQYQSVLLGNISSCSPPTITNVVPPNLPGSMNACNQATASPNLLGFVYVKITSYDSPSLIVSNLSQKFQLAATVLASTAANTTMTSRSALSRMISGTSRVREADMVNNNQYKQMAMLAIDPNITRTKNTISVGSRRILNDRIVGYNFDLHDLSFFL